MRATPRNIVSLVAVGLSLLAGASNTVAGDQAPDRSGRNIALETGRGLPIPAAQSQPGPLAGTMVAPPSDGLRRAYGRADDPIAESFDRMLAHVPSTHRPPVPAGFGVDPLIAAVLEPQRQWQAEYAAARHASARSPRAER